MDTTDTTLDKVQEMITIGKIDNPILIAIAEDENVRRQSRNWSREYVDLLEAEKNHMPEWMWNTLWFILGAFFWESIPAFVNLVDMICKAFGVDLGEYLP